jgi:hypothetical protein
MWLNSCLSLFLVPSRSSSTPLYPWKCCELRSVPQGPDFFVVSTLDSLLSLSRSLGVRQVQRGEKVHLFLLPLATKHWNLPRATKHWTLLKATKHWNFPLATKHWTLSKATKHWNLPLATKHWNLPLALELDLPSPPSFSLFLKGKFGSFGFIFLDITFDFNIESICSYNFPWEEMND